MANEILSPELDALLNEKVINQAFLTAMGMKTGVLSTVRFGGKRPAQNGSELSWLDDKLDADGSELTAGIDAIVTTVPVVNGAIFRIGMIISAKNSDESMLVSAVAGNDLTVVRGFGGTTAEAVLTEVYIKVDNIGREENSTAENDLIHQPTTVLNYFQTMDTALEFSRRALATMQVGNTNDVVQQLAIRMHQLTIQLDTALIKGRKAKETVNGKEITYTGGIKYFLDQEGAILEDNGAAALTLESINNLNTEIVKRGGSADTIAVGIDLARTINDLVGDNFSSARLSDWATDEGAVVYLPTDIPTIAGVNKIVLDTNLNDDELLLYDSKMINIIPMAAHNGDTSGAWNTQDATVKGQDGVRVRVLGDFGMEIRQSQTHFARLKNIG